MKRRILSLALILVLLCALSGCEIQMLDSNAAGTIMYTYGDVTFTDTLSAAEVAEAAKILNGKITFADYPACGFDEDISFTIDGVTFALACDKCGLVKNCDTGLYITISEAQRAVLEAMFTSRGGRFPCV